jgi:plastocyanin
MRLTSRAVVLRENGEAAGTLAKFVLKFTKQADRAKKRDPVAVWRQRVMRWLNPSLIIAALLTASAFLAGACGGAAQGGQPAPSGPQAAAPASTEIAVTQSANGLVETATDNKFSQTNLSVRTGEMYTITVLNKGQAVHNLRIENLKAADGKDVAVPLVEPGKSASTSFTAAKPGTYQFVCDVHPTEMRGTITVGQGPSGP